MSPTHGKRFVNIYVNAPGLSSYKSDAEFPIGSTIVKESWEVKDGKPTDVAGPLFIMVKKEAGFDPDHEDWWYGFHWATPPEKWASRLGAQVYWRSPSKKVNYCWDCHDNFDREIGLPPKEQRNW